MGWVAAGVRGTEAEEATGGVEVRPPQISPLDVGVVCEEEGITPPRQWLLVYWRAKRLTKGRWQGWARGRGRGPLAGR